jgi:hypothetical protein
MEQTLDAQKQLLQLVQQCTTGPPGKRPCFGAVCRKLRSLQKAASSTGLTPRSDSRVTRSPDKSGAANGQGAFATVR